VGIQPFTDSFRNLISFLHSSYILLTLYCIVPFAKQLWSGLSRKPISIVIHEFSSQVYLRNRLECNHSYCFHCIVNWFHESIRTRLSSCYEPLPQNFKDHAEPFTSAEVDMLCDGIYAIIPGRFYHCPICRAFVDEPPIEVPLLRNLFSEINGALGPEVERTEQVSTDPALQWKIFFRKRR
jgi:hypothetical protein